MFSSRHTIFPFFLLGSVKDTVCYLSFDSDCYLSFFENHFVSQSILTNTSSILFYSQPREKNTQDVKRRFVLICRGFEHNIRRSSPHLTHKRPTKSSHKL